MISPFKAALGLDYKAFENRLMAAVHIRYGLPAELPLWVSRLIKRCDKASAFLEATQLAGFEHDEAGRIFGRPRGLDGAAVRLRTLVPEPADVVEANFLKAFGKLQ
jgi:5'-deoxynucleotidase YfbR-like HD superfamily hydrolase